MKNMSFGRAAALLAAMLFTPVLGADPPPGTPSVEAMALYQGPDRNAKLLAAAKTESGELTVYHVYPALTRVIDQFSKKYGIPVKPWRSSSETVLQRLMTEARGNRFEADLVQNNAPENEAACREKLLLEVRSPLHANLVAQAIPAHRCWAGFAIDVFIAAYNTTKVSTNELPKSYEDLLDPRWKGRLGIEADDYGWFGTLASLKGERETHQLFGKLVAGNGLSVRKGHSLLANLVASGEVPMGLTAYSWTPEQLKAKGAPIEVHPIDPMIAQFSTIAVAKRARRPFAALLFYDYLLDEGQKVLADLKFVPASRTLDTPVLKLNIRYIDPSTALEMQDQWLKDYTSIVVKPR
ncbi:MAG: extracellular solute-binding protein [Usitatibacter sp.]